MLIPITSNFSLKACITRLLADCPFAAFVYNQTIYQVSAMILAPIK